MALDLRMYGVLVILGLSCFVAAQEKGTVMVTCSAAEMTIKVPSEDVTWAELDKWAEVPGCGFSSTPEFHSISLPLSEELPCGTTRVRNTVTGRSLFYQRIRLGTSEQTEELLLLKCVAPSDSRSASHNIVKRELPPGFQEPEYIEITSEVTGTAPVPILGVGVRQDGSLVEGAINVQPGTPLTMEVYLDDNSAGTYGILVSFMEVTDNANKEETIVYNGCTIDPNLFENFVTRSGDFLAAKFRAFKFPESNFVMFRGTVDVCIDKCQGITCSDGKIGFGRKKRTIDSRTSDPNKIFEVTMTTYIKFSENSTKSGVPEVIAEETLQERLSYSSPEWEAPLIRRSPDVPPSIAFSGSPTSMIPIVATSLAMVLIARLLS